MNRFLKLSAGILVFDLLFYNQSLGLNLSIFSIIIWIFIYSGRKKKYKDNLFWLLSLSFFISCLSFAWYADFLSFSAVFLSLFVTGIYAQYQKLNFIIYPVIALINGITFPIRFFYFKYWLPVSNGKGGWQKWLSLGIIPAIFVTLFFSVYTTGSTLFNAFYEKIFFNINLPQVIGLTCLSFFLLFNLWFLYIPRILVKLNYGLQNDFPEKPVKSIVPSFSFTDKNMERKGGEITLFLLNILLLIFLLSYNYEQFFTRVEEGNLSNEIHQRIATVITSIVLAIGIILFYFKSKFNFGPSASLLKKLSYTWIILNALLVISALVKNGEYILAFGLTFKRISVFIFLILCLTGLYFTALKIKGKKTNTHLFSKMACTFYISLILFAPINFSWIVTSYNINFNKAADTGYLKSLDYNELLLFNIYRNDIAWQLYFSNGKEKMEEEAKKSVLSTNLYQQYLIWEMKKNQPGLSE